MNNSIMSDQIDQLATALAKAQAEMLVAAKNKKNPYFKSMYADFESIVYASRPSLAKYGLSVVQPPFAEQDNQSYLVTILMHSSGQWIKSKARHNPAKEDVQALASYNTYLKRMCYTSLIGVVTGDEDDDGNAASQTPSNSSYAQRSDYQDHNRAEETEFITKEQLEQMEDVLMGYPDVHQIIIDGFKIKALAHIPKKMFLPSLKRAQEEIRKKHA